MFARTRVLSKCLPAALLWLSAVAPAHAQQAVNRGWPLNADGAVKMWNDAGSIRIIGWDRDSVSVSGTIPGSGMLFGGGDKNGVKFGVENKGGKGVMPADFVVYVPARARVWVHSASSSVDISAFAGALDVSTVSGNVRVQGTPAELRAESMNGTLDVTASPAYLRLKSATGAITWNGSSDDVGITTVSGRVIANAGSLQRGRFETIDGEVRFSGAVGVKGTLAIDTHSGNVLLAFAKGANAQLEISARGLELFGAREGQDRAAAKPLPPKSFNRTVGQASMTAPTIVVRTYKGFVTVVRQ